MITAARLRMATTVIVSSSVRSVIDYVSLVLAGSQCLSWGRHWQSCCRTFSAQPWPRVGNCRMCWIALPGIVRSELGPGCLSEIFVVSDRQRPNLAAGYVGLPVAVFVPFVFPRIGGGAGWCPDIKVPSDPVLLGYDAPVPAHGWGCWSTGKLTDCSLKLPWSPPIGPGIRVTIP
jgi:hypothetical protein